MPAAAQPSRELRHRLIPAAAETRSGAEAKRPVGMPNSVFGRFRRQTQDGGSVVGAAGILSPPLSSSAGVSTANNTSLPSFVPEEGEGEDGGVSPTNTTHAAAHPVYGIFPEPERDRDRKHSHGHKREIGRAHV